MQDALQNAVRLHQAGQIGEALRLYGDIVRRDPANVQALYYMGIALQGLGRTEEALSSLDAALEANANFAPARGARGAILSQAGRHAEALAEYDLALRLDPKSASVWSNRGGSLLELSRFDEALAAFDRALAIDPQFSDAARNRGVVMMAQQRYGEAIYEFDRVLAINPSSADAYVSRGVAQSSLGRQEEAITSFDRALALQPMRDDIFFLKGNSLLAMGRSADAQRQFERVLAIAPSHVDALVNRGVALSQLGRTTEAIGTYDTALRLAPGHIGAHYNRGNALTLLRRFEEAARDCEIVLAANPDFDYARGVLVWSKLQCCDWKGLAEHRKAIDVGLRAGKRVLNPQQNAAICTSDEDQLRCAKLWVSDQIGTHHAPLWRGEAYHHNRIRVGYISADFHEHATAYLMAGLFERHNRSQFEIFAFSSGQDDSSAMRARLVRAIENFKDVRKLTDADLAHAIRAAEIDILVDLKGYTEGGRLLPFAQRSAPIQVSYLGYPGTTGADYMDYVLADRVVIPPEQTRFYSEKIVFLPYSYQCNDDNRAIGPIPARRDAGLPDSGFVFCCFNANYKILPETFDHWCRILKASPGSILWLLEVSELAKRNLRAEAEARGVSPNRLYFAPRTDLPAHLARLSLADLFLDTLPCNAHTTASDALWAGVPVLTLKGQSFAGRVAASLLNAIGLPGMVTENENAFENRAVELARNPDMILQLKQHLQARRQDSPLFKTARFTRDLETAYRKMYEIHQGGHKPEAISIAP